MEDEDIDAPGAAQAELDRMTDAMHDGILQALTQMPKVQDWDAIIGAALGESGVAESAEGGSTLSTISGNQSTSSIISSLTGAASGLFA